MSDLLQIISPEKEAIVLDSLKGAIEDAMIFYGRIIECARDLYDAVEKLKEKRITMFDELAFNTNFLKPVKLAHTDLETTESIMLWQEWSKAAIAYLNYVFKVADMGK